ncbi:transporter substrate-binding domain-containing protein [Zhaonella formicivorans]|uniref:transporter substrate-binding domain-containing protein n=1 Tax=Zhaonella formicivorans TaxID=2528593 RepID=UPI0010D7B255|nr:transporter substrate-binding domain-containing protein [Zhaonella formicivorans]
MQITKRLCATLFCLIIYCLLFPLQVQATPSHTIRIAGDENYPPYEYVDDNGMYKGFNVDIMRAVAIELGMDIELIPMTWQEALVALENGQVDAIQGMTKSKIREERFAFTEALVVNSQAIFVRKETNYVTELKDLAGMPVAFQAGDISSELLRSIPEVIPIIKDDQEEALKALLTGEVEAFVGNRLTGLYILQKERQFDKIKIVGEPLYSTEYCSAVLKGNTQTLALLNQGIAAIKANGTYDKIYRKWFGETFVDASRFWKRLLAAAIIVLLLTLGMIIATMSWNRGLKREVERRTQELASANDELYARQLKLEQSNRLRGKILESTLDAIITFNQQGQVLTANSAAKALLGKEISPGLTWGDLGLGQKLGSDVLNKALTGTVWRRDLEWVKSQTERRFINCSLSPIKGPEGAVEGVILVLHDYTEEKKLKDALYQNDKMQALGTLAAGIAHELRNPLTAIKAYIDLLPIKFDNPNFRQQIIATVPQEMQRLNNIVSVLLDYARPKPITPQRVELSELIREVFTLFAAHIKQKRIEMTTDYEPAAFWADGQQIKQVLINILLNSIEAVGDGGMIAITGCKQGSQVILKIQDNGCGIPPEALDKIFDPFYTLKPGGYGLGLAICYQLLKDNGGRICYTSNSGEGTTATIYLPAAPEEGEKQHA